MNSMIAVRIPIGTNKTIITIVAKTFIRHSFLSGKFFDKVLWGSYGKNHKSKLLFYTLLIPIKYLKILGFHTCAIIDIMAKFIVLIILILVSSSIKGEEDISYNDYAYLFMQYLPQEPAEQSQAEIIDIGEEPTVDVETTICEYVGEEYICYTLRD